MGGGGQGVEWRSQGRHLLLRRRERLRPCLVRGDLKDAGRKEMHSRYESD